jgi:putative ABC transport system ATP-binding protein
VLLKESAHYHKKCVIVVTHSAELAREADVVYGIKKGVLQTMGPPQSRKK